LEVLFKRGFHFSSKVFEGFEVFDGDKPVGKFDVAGALKYIEEEYKDSCWDKREEEV